MQACRLFTYKPEPGARSSPLFTATPAHFYSAIFLVDLHS